MKNIPDHVLEYQQGGVAPIKAPLMEGQQMSPLIQVASMPVDVGVETALRLRQQELFRDQMRQRKEEFEWQKESWKQEFDLKTQNSKAFNNLKLLEIFDNLTSQQMSTGVSRGTASRTGMPMNFHTAAQQKALQDVEVAKNKKVMDFMKSIKGDLANIDPSAYYQLRSDLAQTEGDVYRNALEQATYHQQQIDQFKEDPGSYDAELFAGGLLNYSTSQDVKSRHEMLYPSLEKMAKDTWEVTKDQWGLPQSMTFDTGLSQVFQANPDRRREFADYLINNNSATLNAKYERQKQLAAQGKAPDPGDYQTFATDYAEMLANNFLTPGYKTTGSPTKPVTSDGETSNATSPIYTPETNVQNWVGAVDAIPQAPVDANAIYNPIHISEQYRNKLLGVTGFGSDLSVKPEDLGYAPMTPEMKNSLQLIANAVTGVNGNADLSSYIDENNRLTKEGRGVVEEYKKMFAERITQGLLVTSWVDAKENGVFSTATTSDDAVKHFYNNLGSVRMMDVDTGEMLTGQDFNKRYFEDYDSSHDKMKSVTSMPGIIDPRNILPLVANENNQIVNDPGVFGASPYYMEFTEKDGTIKRFAVKREDSWLQSQVGQRYKGGSGLYQDAIRGIGTDVTPKPSDISASLNGLGATADDVSRIQNNVKSVRLGKYEMGESTIDTTVIQYDSEGKTATGKLEIIEPFSAGVGMMLMDTLATNLGPEHTVNITQGRDPNTRTMGFIVKVDDLDPFAIIDSKQHAGLNVQKIQQSLYDAEGGGRIDGTTAVKRGIIDNGVDMNLSKQFVSDWEKTMDPILPNGYKITSAFRMGDPTAGKGRTLDLTGRDETLNRWFQDNVPGIKQVSGTHTAYYQIPNTPFAVTWHQNMNLIRDDKGNVIKKVPTSGHHFDIKYANEVTLR